MVDIIVCTVYGITFPSNVAETSSTSPRATSSIGRFITTTPRLRVRPVNSPEPKQRTAREKYAERRLLFHHSLGLVLKNSYSRWTPGTPPQLQHQRHPKWHFLVTAHPTQQRLQAELGAHPASCQALLPMLLESPLGRISYHLLGLLLRLLPRLLLRLLVRQAVLRRRLAWLSAAVQSRRSSGAS